MVFASARVKIFTVVCRVLVSPLVSSLTASPVTPLYSIIHPAVVKLIQAHTCLWTFAPAPFFLNLFLPHQAGWHCLCTFKRHSKVFH